MDPNLGEQIDYFSVPNNQIPRTVDQGIALTIPATSVSQPPLWDVNVPVTSSATTSTPPIPQTGLTWDSMPQTQVLQAAQRLRRPSSGPTKVPPQKLVAQQQIQKDGHDRKRTKRSSEAARAEQADYWPQFDSEELSASAQLGSLRNSNMKGKVKSTPAKRSLVDANILSGGAIASIVDQEKDEEIDDSALDKALSDEEDAGLSLNLTDHLAQLDSLPPSEVPPREGLYSTPLSWEKPQPGLRMDSLIGLQSPTLNAAEQARLIAIALNPGSTMGGLGSSMSARYGPAMSSNLGFDYLTPSFGQYPTYVQEQSLLGGVGVHQPVPLSQARVRPQAFQPSTQAWSSSQSSLPRPPGVEAPPHRGPRGCEKGKEKAKSGDRTTHNDIERKYRTNLKDKITELRDAVPALRAAQDAGDVDADEESGQPHARPKVSKGTVLTKATEYIHQLEKKNKAILREHQELSRRLQVFEQLLSAATRPTFQMPNYSRDLFDPRGFC